MQNPKKVFIDMGEERDVYGGLLVSSAIAEAKFISNKIPINRDHILAKSLCASLSRCLSHSFTLQLVFPPSTSFKLLHFTI